MTLDCKRAVPLLIQNRDIISPPEVVKQLLSSDNKPDCRYFLHLYLHSLFEVNPHAGKDFHDMQVGFVSFISKHNLFFKFTVKLMQCQYLYLQWMRAMLVSFSVPLLLPCFTYTSNVTVLSK